MKSYAHGKHRTICLYRRRGGVLKTAERRKRMKSKVTGKLDLPATFCM